MDVDDPSELEQYQAPRFLKWLPGLALVCGYQRRWLRHDVIAGLVLTAILVPQGMAYAQLAGLPAVTGLYTSVVALVAYALFGPSRVLVIGPDSALGPMIGAAILPLVAANGDPARAVALASTLALLMGLICLIAGIAHAGTVTELLSKPVRVGYWNGLALVVLAGQLPKLCGFSTDAHGFAADVRSFLEGVSSGKVVPASLLIGLGSLGAILLLRSCCPRIPGVFLVVVASTVLVNVFDLSAHGVAVLGVIPSGFPAPSVPHVAFHDVRDLMLPALGMAFVTLADTSVLSRSLAARSHRDIDQNRELLALGASNMATGLFQGFPVSGSAGRTVVAETTGSRTQLTGLVGAGCLLVLLLFAHSLLRDLPTSALAAIVISAALKMFDVEPVTSMWKIRKSECVLSLAATLGVVAGGVLVGIGVAIALSLGEFLRRAWRPHSAILGRMSGRKGYHDLERHPEATQVPGLLLYRFDAPLFFANAEFFSDGIKEAIASNGRSISWVIIAAEAMTDVDFTAAEVLSRLIDDLEASSIQLAFAELKGPVKDRLRDYRLYDRLGDSHFFPTVGTAVNGYLTTSGVEWVDWSD